MDRPLSSEENCLVINASDVTLDCRDMRINSEIKKGNNGIFAENQKNISISGCNISGFENGIQLKNVDNAQIRKNNITNSGVYGLMLHYFTKNVVIANNSIADAGHVCMLLSGGNGSSYDRQPSNHTVAQNSMNRCKDVGIHMYDSVSGIQGTENKILNSGCGISSDRGSGNRFLKSEISAVSTGIRFVLAANDNIFEDFTIDQAEVGVDFEHWGNNNNNIFRNGRIAASGSEVRVNTSQNNGNTFYDTPISRINSCPSVMKVCSGEQCQYLGCDRPVNEKTPTEKN